MTMADAEFISLPIAVLTISDTRGEAEDVSGKLLVERLEAAGHRCYEKAIVKDDKYQIREVVSRWINEAGVHAVLTTGGTGITGRDGTPEAIKPLLDKEIEGFGEMFRVLSYDEIKTSTLQFSCFIRRCKLDVYFRIAWFIGCVPAGVGQDHSGSA